MAGTFLDGYVSYSDTEWPQVIPRPWFACGQFGLLSSCWSKYKLAWYCDRHTCRISSCAYIILWSFTAYQQSSLAYSLFIYVRFPLAGIKIEAAPAIVRMDRHRDANLKKHLRRDGSRGIIGGWSVHGLSEKPPNFASQCLNRSVKLKSS